MSWFLRLTTHVSVTTSSTVASTAQPNSGTTAKSATIRVEPESTLPPFSITRREVWASASLLKPTRRKRLPENSPALLASCRLISDSGSRLCFGSHILGWGNIPVLELPSAGGYLSTGGYGKKEVKRLFRSEHFTFKAGYRTTYLLSDHHPYTEKGGPPLLWCG